MKQKQKKAWVKDLYWIPKSELDMSKVKANFVLELAETDDELDLLYCYKERKIKGVPYIGLPRGNPKLVRYCLEESSYWKNIEDKQTDAPVKFNLQFNGKYRDYQKTAIKEMVESNNGVLKAMPRTGKCVAGNTIIVTNRGYKRIEDLNVGLQLSSNANGECYFEPNEVFYVPTTCGSKLVNAIYACPNVRTYKVKTDLGYMITCTDDERLLVNGSWVKVQDLQIGSTIELQNNHFYINKSFEEDYTAIDREFALLKGYLTALTKIKHKANSWHLNTSDTVITRIKNVLDRLSISYTIEAKSLTLSTKDSFLLENSCITNILNSILGRRDLLISFIRGLYEISFQYNRIDYWKVPSLSLAVELQTVLLNEGIICRRINRKIYFTNIRKFYRLIGFRLRRHLSAYEPQPDLKPEAKVIAIEEAKTTTVYDLVVGSTEAEHNFVANGFKVHNTVMGTGALAKLQQKTLILAHQTDLIEQFCNETINHPEGLLFNGASSKKPIAGICKSLKDFEKYPICLATYQTFISKGGMKLLDKIKDMFGVVLVDEVHRTPAERYSQVIAKFSARRMYGLTATDDRKDSKYRLAELMIGSVFHKVQAKSLSAKVSGILCKYPNTRKPKTWNGMMSFLFNNEKRNKRIALKALADVKRGHTVLIPVTQHAHALSIQNFIKLYSNNPDIVFLFTGQIPKNKRQWARDQMNNNPKIKIVIAMRSMLTGVNIPRWSCIYTVVPISNEPNYTQEVFRVCTPMEGKKTPLIRFFFDTELGASYGCLKTCLKTLGKPENGFHFCKSFKRVLEYKPNDTQKSKTYSSYDEEGATYKAPYSQRQLRF